VPFHSDLNGQLERHLQEDSLKTKTQSRHARGRKLSGHQQARLLPPLVVWPTTSDRCRELVEIVFESVAPGLKTGQSSTVTDRQLEEYVHASAAALGWHLAALSDPTRRDGLLKELTALTSGAEAALLPKPTHCYRNPIGSGGDNIRGLALSAMFADFSAELGSLDHVDHGRDQEDAAREHQDFSNVEAGEEKHSAHGYPQSSTRHPPASCDGNCGQNVILEPKRASDPHQSHRPAAGAFSDERLHSHLDLQGSGLIWTPGGLPSFTVAASAEHVDGHQARYRR
jgi:hypothetical protein